MHSHNYVRPVTLAWSWWCWRYATRVLAFSLCSPTSKKMPEIGRSDGKTKRNQTIQPRTCRFHYVPGLSVVVNAARYRAVLVFCVNDDNMVSTRLCKYFVRERTKALVAAVLFNTFCYRNCMPGWQCAKGVERSRKSLYLSMDTQHTQSQQPSCDTTTPWRTYVDQCSRTARDRLLVCYSLGVHIEWTQATALAAVALTTTTRPTIKKRMAPALPWGQFSFNSKSQCADCNNTTAVRLPAAWCRRYMSLERRGNEHVGLWGVVGWASDAASVPHW